MRGVKVRLDNTSVPLFGMYQIAPGERIWVGGVVAIDKNGYAKPAAPHDKSIGVAVRTTDLYISKEFREAHKIALSQATEWVG